MADQLTKAYFTERVGQAFRVALAESELELALVEVKALGEPSAASISATEPTTGTPTAGKPTRQEAFSLVFRGPADTALGQGIFNLSQAGTDTVDAIFLVPIAADEQGRYYEAIFN